MEKKLYIYPKTDVHEVNTSELMKASGTSPDLPSDPTPAPRRKTDVF